MRVVSFGNYTFPQYEGLHTYPILARNNVVNINTGGIDLSGPNLSLGARQILVQFVISDIDGSIDNQIRTMMQAFNNGTRLLTIISDDNIEYHHFAKLNSINTNLTAANNCSVQVNATFDIFYPYFWPVLDTVKFLDTGLVLDGTWNFDEGNAWTTEVLTGGNSGSLTINNTSGKPLTNLEFYYEITSGLASTQTLTQLRITNQTNGYQMTLNINETDGVVNNLLNKIWWIDTGNRVTTDNKIVNYPLSQYEWFLLDEGNNTIDVSVVAVGLGGSWGATLYVYHPNEVLF